MSNNINDSIGMATGEQSTQRCEWCNGCGVVKIPCPARHHDHSSTGDKVTVTCGKCHGKGVIEIEH